jgi:tRNA dimethylallyltransferase
MIHVSAYSRPVTSNRPAGVNVPVIVGPTGIGKSQLAFELALELGGEIVVADSRQVYRVLDIATNKPPPAQRRQVRYHMIDFVDPAATFNARDYITGAEAAIADIASRDRVPIIEGGTMLYVDALCDGFSLTGVPPNPDLRARLNEMNVTALREILLAIDPDPGVDLQNPVRMVRAIEVLQSAGPPLRRLRKRTAPTWTPYRVGLTAALQVIDGRLEQRSRQQVERGLIAETESALNAGVPTTAPVLTGIGYAEALAYIRGDIPIEQLPVTMAQSNRQYARKQLRWWRRDPRVRWFDIDATHGTVPVTAILNYLKENGFEPNLG